jgi:hypothetical protein
MPYRGLLDYMQPAELCGRAGSLARFTWPLPNQRARGRYRFRGYYPSTANSSICMLLIHIVEENLLHFYLFLAVAGTQSLLNDATLRLL